MSRRPADECQRTVRTMLATLRHRADYIDGVHCAADIGIYTGWSAHPGSFAHRASTQCEPPIRIAFSGEFWRDADETVAVAPAGNNLPAWIAPEYRAHGMSFLERCSGMFSGVLIDDDARRAWIFNDRFPMERLYVHETGDDLLFASEAKAILAVAGSTRDFDERAVADFLAFGSVLGRRTLFRGIESLPGATLLRVDAPGRRTRIQYFLPAAWESAPTLTEPELRGRLATLLPTALSQYMRTPERVGLSLTGGLDTRMILACGIPRITNAVCYTFDGFEGRTLDTSIGERLARMRGLPHQVLRLDGSFLARFHEHVDRTAYVSDGTAGLLAAHEIPLNAMARQLADVRITGNFGSEVMRTMSTFKRVVLAGGLLEGDMVRAVDEAAAGCEQPSHPVTRAAFAEVPWHLFGTLAAARSQLVVRAPFLDNALLRVAYAAPPDSRIGVGTTLAAIAACDPAVATVPTDRGVAYGSSPPMQWLRRLYCAVTFKLDYLDHEGLARSPRAADAALALLRHSGVMGLHKYLPYRRWFRSELMPYAESALDEAASRQLPYWNAAAVRALPREHAAGVHNRLREMHVVLTLDAVRRTLLHYPS